MTEDTRGREESNGLPPEEAERLAREVAQRMLTKPKKKPWPPKNNPNATKKALVGKA